MNATAPTVSRTRSFSTVFLIEMWERFGYYGMQALIIYYMVQRLGFEDTPANLTWSAAAALIYVSPAIGGWVGDKFFGTRRTMLLGAMVLAVGYALMVVPAHSFRKSGRRQRPRLNRARIARAYGTGGMGESGG